MEDYSTFMHEINNRLNAVYGLSELIGITNDIDEIHNYAGMLRDTITHIRSINEDFNIYRRTGRKTLHMSIVDIRKILSSTVDECANCYLKHDITINKILKPARAYTDASKFKQVLVNIIDNACKYSNPKSEVDVLCYTNDNTTVVEVIDHGVGMTSDEVKKIGTPFYRAGKIKRSGTGLGMSVVKKTCRLLNWDILIDSTPGEGTKVKLILYHITG